MAQCVLCGNRAVFKTEEGPLCREHFSAWFEAGIEKTLQPDFDR